MNKKLRDGRNTVAELLNDEERPKQLTFEAMLHGTIARFSVRLREARGQQISG